MNFNNLSPYQTIIRRYLKTTTLSSSLFGSSLHRHAYYSNISSYSSLLLRLHNNNNSVNKLIIKYAKTYHSTPYVSSLKNQHGQIFEYKKYYSSARDSYYHQKKIQNQTLMYYTGAVILFFLGMSYAGVPLYELICTQTGLDGTPVTAPGHKFDPADMKPVEGAKSIKITFDSSVSDKMKWKFVPVTREMKVVPGETALAFYTAKNETEEDIVGISTYSVVPAKAAQYFNKIQCFCFEEQLLTSGEEVDMPVFFYLDPEFAYDPWMKDVTHITLNYTFFKSKFQNVSPLKGM